MEIRIVARGVGGIAALVAVLLAITAYGARPVDSAAAENAVRQYLQLLNSQMLRSEMRASGASVPTYEAALAWKGRYEATQRLPFTSVASRCSIFSLLMRRRRCTVRVQFPDDPQPAAQPVRYFRVETSWFGDPRVVRESGPIAWHLRI